MVEEDSRELLHQDALSSVLEIDVVGVEETCRGDHEDLGSSPAEKEGIERRERKVSSRASSTFLRTQNPATASQKIK